MQMLYADVVCTIGGKGQKIEEDEVKWEEVATQWEKKYESEKRKHEAERKRGAETRREFEKHGTTRRFPFLVNVLFLFHPILCLCLFCLFCLFCLPCLSYLNVLILHRYILCQIQ